MRMFEPVVIGCDQGRLDVALAIRSALELFHLRVHLYDCRQKLNVADFLRGNIPESKYVVLCCGGWWGDMQMKSTFQVVDQLDGRWVSTEFSLTPADISKYVSLQGRTVISLGCNTGKKELADAFLDAGCSAYIGPDGALDQDSAAMFVVAFFYHLLRSDREPALACTDRQAVELAAALDAYSKEGTHVFRYHGSE